MVDYPDVINFSRDELLEEYCKLFDRFQELRESNEVDTQKIHELKRSLDTANAAQIFLSQELEQYANCDGNKIEEELHKARTELHETKRKCSELEASFANLQQDYNLLLEESSKIKNLEEPQKSKDQSEVGGKILDDYLMRIELLENENMDLLQKIEDFEEHSVRYTLTIAEYEKNIEILRDQIMCLEENLQSKRADLEEKTQILESTQEQLAEANAKIAMLSSDSDNNDRKGNSLFAEVDDQRQAMKQLLTAQKKSYLQMKKIYNESEHEIRRLKRENISMRTEFEACSAIFCNADKIYQEKLNERIRNLLDQNDELERKLKWTQGKLKELAADKGVFFFDSMLSFCKKETDDLKCQLQRVRLQNASLEEHLRNAQQDMARWRFESLKSRCVLIDREYLLTANKIVFKPIHALEYNINKKDLEDAKPRIVSNRRSILENVIDRKSISPSKEPIQQKTISPQQNLAESSDILNNVKKEPEEQFNKSADQSVILCNMEKLTFEPGIPVSEMEKTNNAHADSLIVKSILKNKQENNYEEKENADVSVEDMPMFKRFAQLRAKSPLPPSPMRPSQNYPEKFKLKTSATTARSILTKQNDLLFKDSCKNVKFSSEENTVFNLSSNACSPISSKTIKTDGDSTTKKMPNKSAVKKSCTKSNIKVRRVVVSSKHN